MSIQSRKLKIKSMIKNPLAEKLKAKHEKAFLRSKVRKVTKFLISKTA